MLVFTIVINLLLVSLLSILLIKNYKKYKIDSNYSSDSSIEEISVERDGDTWEIYFRENNSRTKLARPSTATERNNSKIKSRIKCKNLFSIDAIFTVIILILINIFSCIYMKTNLKEFLPNDLEIYSLSHFFQVRNSEFEVYGSDNTGFCQLIRDGFSTWVNTTRTKCTCLNMNTGFSFECPCDTYPKSPSSIETNHTVEINDDFDLINFDKIYNFWGKYFNSTSMETGSFDYNPYLENISLKMIGISNYTASGNAHIENYPLFKSMYDSVMEQLDTGNYNVHSFKYTNEDYLTWVPLTEIEVNNINCSAVKNLTEPRSARDYVCFQLENKLSTVEKDSYNIGFHMGNYYHLERWYRIEEADYPIYVTGFSAVIVQTSKTETSWAKVYVGHVNWVTADNNMYFPPFKENITKVKEIYDNEINPKIFSVENFTEFFDAFLYSQKIYNGKLSGWYYKTKSKMIWNADFSIRSNKGVECEVNYVESNYGNKFYFQCVDANTREILSEDDIVEVAREIINEDKRIDHDTRSYTCNLKDTGEIETPDGKMAFSLIFNKAEKKTFYNVEGLSRWDYCECVISGDGNCQKLNENDGWRHIDKEFSTFDNMGKGCWFYTQGCDQIRINQSEIDIFKVEDVGIKFSFNNISKYIVTHQNIPSINQVCSGTLLCMNENQCHCFETLDYWQFGLFEKIDLKTFDKQLNDYYKFDSLEKCYEINKVHHINFEIPKVQWNPVKFVYSMSLDCSNESEYDSGFVATYPKCEKKIALKKGVKRLFYYNDFCETEETDHQFDFKNKNIIRGFDLTDQEMKSCIKGSPYFSDYGNERLCNFTLYDYLSGHSEEIIIDNETEKSKDSIKFDKNFFNLFDFSGKWYNILIKYATYVCIIIIFVKFILPFLFKCIKKLNKESKESSESKEV